MKGFERCWVSVVVRIDLQKEMKGFENVGFLSGREGGSRVLLFYAILGREGKEGVKLSYWFYELSCCLL